MKNALSYYYHLYPETLVYHNHEYTFLVDNWQYRLLPVTRPLEEMREIYELNRLLLATSFAEIILNRLNNYVTAIQQKYYILVKEKVEDRLVTVMDLLSNFNFIPLEQFRLLNRSNWIDLWTKKIDYFEYQKSYIEKKYPLLYTTLDYYIGLAENAISYVMEVIANKVSFSGNLTITRKRVGIDMSIKEFYNPLNIVIDYQVRDMVEYFKSLFLHDYYSEDVINHIIEQIHYNQFEWGLFMGRMLFPSFYFDYYEKIINGIISEKEIIGIIDKSEDYEFFLQSIYYKIKRQVNIPRIDWLDK